MKKKILSTIFSLSACICLGLGLTACGGGEADPIKYAQSVLQKYGENYDYVYEYDEQIPEEADGYIGGWHTYDCYVSTKQNKTTLAKTEELSDSKYARTIVDYFEFAPATDGVSVFHYDIHDLTYTSDVLTQKEFEKAYPYLLENAVNAFANFDPDNLDFDTDDPYFKREDTRVYEKKVDNNKITLENTCNYHVGSIPSEEERDKEHPDPNYKGSDTLGFTMQIDRKTGHIINMRDENASREIEYSYNRGTKTVATTYFGTTKKEAISKILQDMTVSQPTGNYQMESTIDYGVEDPDHIVAIYDAEKNMTKSVDDDGEVRYQKIEINEDATEDEIYLTMTFYKESDHTVSKQTFTKDLYLALVNSSVFALNSTLPSFEIDPQNFDENEIEIQHDEEAHTTIVTLTKGEEIITITFKGGSNFTVKQQTPNRTIEYSYTNHALAKLISKQDLLNGNESTTEVTYTYGVQGFDFDESEYSAQGE